MDNILIDMHVHSLVSDGLLNPSEVIKSAAQNKISRIVFTEHNSVHSKFNQIKKYAKELGVDIPFPGTEVNTVYVRGGEPILKFHLLIYGNQILDNDFQNLIALGNIVQNEYIYDLYNQLVSQNIISRNFYDILDELNEKNEQIKYEKKMYTRSILVQEIMRSDEYKNFSKEEIKERFLPPLDKFLKYENYLNIYDVIKKAKELGAVCVLAHPGWVRNYNKSGKLELKDLPNIILDLKQHGLDGIEVNHRLNNQEARKLFKEISIENDMIITGGSDFHGKPRCKFGECTMELEHYEELVRRIK